MAGPVASIGDSAFIDCGSLVDISLPNTVAYIGSYAFTSCHQLASVVIPPGVSEIRDFLFAGCSSLTNVMLPGAITNIGDYAFSGCINLKFVDLPDSVTRLGVGAFRECTNFAEVKFGFGIKDVGDYCFASCVSLTNIVIPVGVTNIGDFAFLFCTGITEIVIPDSVTQLGPNAFEGDSNLTTISVDVFNPAYSSMSGVLFDKTRRILMRCPEGKSGNYSVPSDVTRIDGGAFYLCSRLVGVTIPGGVYTIRAGAFIGCTSLAGISVDPLNATYSDLDGVLFDKAQHQLLAFPGGRGGGYVIPSGVQAIGDFAFSGCSRLTHVTVPSGVTAMGQPVFFQCDSLTEISVDKLNPSFRSIDGVLFDKAQSVLLQFPPGKAGDYSITNGVKIVGDGAFSFSAAITNVTVPASVARVGDGAWSWCAVLESVHFWGDAPVAGVAVFQPVSWAARPTVYYLPGTVGWASFLGETPIAAWQLPGAVILESSSSFGMTPNGFGFTISWATNAGVVVEAAANPGSTIWEPLSTNSIYFTPNETNWFNGASRFVDPQATNYPSRIYRLHW